MSYGKHRESFLDKFIKLLRARKIARWIPKNATLVDLGCGYRGDLLSSLAHRIKMGLGYDLEVKETHCANNIKLFVAKIDEHIPLPDECVDVVTCLAVVEHLLNPEILYQETFRILKPGGIFLFTTPSKRAKPILEFMAFKLQIISREEIADHKRYYNRNELYPELVKAGFSSDQISIQYFQMKCNIFGTAKKYKSQPMNE